ncbi:hypothetical protein [Phaeovulum vinaykumarii]|uniref:Uncharacterized protein n=1 Tax=Phaeovulum vinaykumarii TaxID=407234 RepID=A0A1N7L2Z7_9RHOB|nr:hypothetical protein [Phaeovulum vinaykumarii]SIS68030.1 hypothetical protein SAMN05421795_102468 [Phaeovulum vinaykumarii]SOC00390.1 hypothetical protein SAMN05878426_102304 [Phaeovulum vinaykumarii]
MPHLHTFFPPARHVGRLIHHHLTLTCKVISALPELRRSGDPQLIAMADELERIACNFPDCRDEGACRRPAPRGRCPGLRSDGPCETPK